MTVGGSGGRPASGGGAGGGGTPRTTTGRATTTSHSATTQPPATTAPPIQVTGLVKGPINVACNQQPDGRWHLLVEFRGLIYTKGAGTVRYQWGRGGGDIRSDVRTYTVNKALAVGESFYPATDRISGSTDSPTDAVIDRLHILAPVPKGLADLEMTAKICP